VHDILIFFFFQAEDGIRDLTVTWSSDVCSSDLTHSLHHRGPARVFDCEEDAFAAVQARNYKPGDVIVIRYEGPKGGPGMREMLRSEERRVGKECRCGGSWYHE